MLDLDQDTSRPQVLISGEIHGDERVVSFLVFDDAASITYQTR